MLPFVHFAAHTALAVPQARHTAPGFDAAADEDDDLERRRYAALREKRDIRSEEDERMSGADLQGCGHRAGRGAGRGGLLALLGRRGFEAYTSPSPANTTRSGGFRPSSLFRVFDQARVRAVRSIVAAAHRTILPPAPAAVPSTIGVTRTAERSRE
ncbi:hypothetical protein B0H16DRAFT_823184 [Mycena metata]|uniref:Uncharacterized protein n=1 Tax=Mycena metata TaxID=1033252 RepID=A0AAD7N8U0_9AGAR|nr:hypothetical protein B0H16DRAFT_823184 [Mycena metata]